jgi:catechol 2,3-dioxygenase-like lactoylglutathione lyase family enzyme
MPLTPTTTVNVRYMVDDVDAAVAWYTKHLGFTLPIQCVHDRLSAAIRLGDEIEP